MLPREVGKGTALRSTRWLPAPALRAGEEKQCVPAARMRPRFQKPQSSNSERFLLSSPPDIAVRRNGVASLAYDPGVHVEAQLQRKPESLTKLRRRVDCRIKSIKSGNDERKKGSGTPTSAQSILRISRCGSHPAGCARLSAFHRGSCQRDCSSPRLSLRPCFLGPGRSARSDTAAPTGGAETSRCSTGVTRAAPVPVQRSTSRAGHSAGRMMPEPPGSQGDEPRPAGTALAPSVGVTGDVPWVSEIHRCL